MNKTPLQGMHCAWKSFEIWGMVKGEEIVHLSFNRKVHPHQCAWAELEPVSQDKQEALCAFLLSALQGLVIPFPQKSPFISQGTPFQQRVWRALSCIPYGDTRTYGEIASELGNPKLARAVGQACNKNPLPIIIPCHRVVSSQGLGGFAGGSQIKQSLLDYERAWINRASGD